LYTPKESESRDRPADLEALAKREKNKNGITAKIWLHQEELQDSEEHEVASGNVVP